MLKTQVVERRVGQALTTILRTDLCELFGIVAVENPLLTHTGQTFLQVDLYRRVGERTAGIIDIYWCIGFHVGHTVFVARHRRSEVDFGHTDTDIGEQLARHVCFLTLGVSLVIVDHNRKM